MLKQLVSTVFCVFCLSFSAVAKDAVAYKSEMGYDFINGGISEEEVSQIKKIGKNYSLQVLFSLGEAGAWIADVRFMVLDGAGNTMFTKQVAGPLLFVNLPAGDYQVIGRYNGVRESKRITLSGEPKRVILNWKDESEEYSTNSKADNNEP